MASEDPQKMLRSLRRSEARRAGGAINFTKRTPALFWAKVDKRSENECWPWLAGCLRDGRGILTIRDRNHTAPRVSWVLHNGPIPDDMHVCHSCDNPSCVNPAHLWLGTPKDNLMDASRKGRCSMQRNPSASFFASQAGKVVRARGSKHHQAKLHEDEVRLIRNLRDGGMPQKALAEMFGVSRGVIGSIVRREAWRHI